MKKFFQDAPLARLRPRFIAFLHALNSCEYMAFIAILQATILLGGVVR